MIAWEYKLAIVNKHGVEKKLEVLGLEGWELINVLSQNYDITLYMKRPIGNFTPKKEVKKVEKVVAPAKKKAKVWDLLKK